MSAAWWAGITWGVLTAAATAMFIREIRRAPLIGPAPEDVEDELLGWWENQMWPRHEDEDLTALMLPPGRETTAMTTPPTHTCVGCHAEPAVSFLGPACWAKVPQFQTAYRQRQQAADRELNRLRTLELAVLTALHARADVQGCV